MESLVSVVLQQGPGYAVVCGVMQQDTLSCLVWSWAGAQRTSAAESEGELEVSVQMRAHAHATLEWKIHK